MLPCLQLHLVVVQLQVSCYPLLCRDCILDGSSHVAQLKLNHAFNVLVKVVFTWVCMQTKQAFSCSQAAACTE